MIPRAEIDVLGAAVHIATAALHATRLAGSLGPKRRGALDVLHGLGYLYNARRGGVLDASALMHAWWFVGDVDDPVANVAWLLFDGQAALTHARRALSEATCPRT